MDIITKLRGFLATWSSGGEEQCRQFLAPLHSNPSDAKSADALATAYHTLLTATLSSWKAQDPLSPSAFVSFVQSTLQALPSSSHDASPAPASAQAIGETLVDTIWAMDSQLDEILVDVKSAAAAASEAAGGEGDASGVTTVKKNAEKDKDVLVDIAKQLLSAGILDPGVCRERLDIVLIANAGLVTDKPSFDRKEIRTRTGLFYKQNKFNLLREQSEGYSKLITEVTSSLPPPHSMATGRPTESFEVVAARVRPVWERVVSLIGYFDLDPNRALDVILDVFSVHLTTHWSFFIVLLGFKFRHYQSPEVTETTPRHLYLTAALLIREGFITLEDLYPHITPTDEDMEEKEHKAYLASVDTRIANAKISQLAMAAPLESSDSRNNKSRPSTVSEPKPAAAAPEPKQPPNQKLGVLIALLSVGALRPAFALLSRFRWLVDAHPEVADLIIRAVKHAIAPLYDSHLVTKERKPSYMQPRPRYSATGLIQVPTRKPGLTLWAPTPPSTSTVDFVYFFPCWADRVPVCVKLNDLVDVVEPLMAFIGLHVSREAIFLTKFLRLGRLHIQSSAETKDGNKRPLGTLEPDHPVRQFWFKVLRVYLLPALPLIRGNAVCTVEIWHIIRQFETTVRWRLYGEWKTRTYQSHPELRVVAVQADRESKGIMRRLSHNTIDTLSGTVAKLAHSNPCIFFRNAVNQIMAYDNLAGVVIQALKYVTNMGFDVLVYIILEALSNPNKARVKDDGVNTSDWLQSLASFTGMLFRRYSADITPLLKYIVHQLYNNQTTEIVVLRELIWKLAGIEPLPSLSDAQVTAMAGGPTLRIEAVASVTRGARLDPAEVFKGPQRLGKALLDSSLALPLLIQVAQQRQSAVYQTQDAHLKSIASLYDTTHGVLLQYLELLTTPSVIPAQDYAAKIVPSLGELGELYGICAPIVMQIMRPILQASLLKSALAMNEQERIAGEEAERRLKAALAAKRDPSAANSRIASPGSAEPPTSDPNGDAKPATQDLRPSEDVVMEDTVVTTPPQSESPWVPEIEALFDDLKKVAPKEAYDIVGPGFYMTFWQLSTYDLAPPSSKYDEEGANLRALSRQEDTKYVQADRSSDRTKRQTAFAHRSRRERYNMFVHTLAQELKEQMISRMYTIKRLNKEKGHWFRHSTKAAVLSSAIIEHCIQPRCLLSPMDADYCVQMIKVIHTLGTPGFSTLMVYDKLLGEHAKVIVFSCSEYEARNYGRFLLGILTDLYKWYQDEQVYMQDNRVKVSGRAVWLPGFQRQFSNNATVEPSAVLSWTNFQQIMRKWHRKLFKSLAECIQTGEFMHVYNAIIVLKEILPVFPLANVAESLGMHLNQVMIAFLEKEKRGDLKILGKAYHASLLKRESYWASPKSAVPKPVSVSTASPRPISSSPAPAAAEKPKTVSTVSTTASQTDKSRIVSTPTPSAPRAQLVTNGGAEKPGLEIPSTKMAISSIPRPEVVRRVRTDARSATPTQPAANGKAPEMKPQPMDVDTAPAADSRQPKDISALRPSPRPTGIAPIPRPETPGGPARKPPAPPAKDTSRPHTPVSTNVPSKAPPQSPRSHRAAEERPQRHEFPPAMPPPSAPSQTGTAQGLRDTAKSTLGRRGEDQDERIHRPPPSEPRHITTGSRAPSPSGRHRSPSPRPGTRNTSSESRRSRSDRGDGDRLEDKRGERGDLRPERREMGLHRGERRERTSTRESDRERDKERGRDRHGDRERERERDRDRERERDREPRDRDRDRDARDRERDRDRGDRHRRDDKDRDRESRKDRDMLGRGIGPSPTDEPSMLGRPDLSRHRSTQATEDALGKRRRPVEDDPERAAKRSSRERSHRDERGRRSSEKEHERPRESDRRRRERDVSDADARSVPSDKPVEKRIPEGPASAKALPATTPSAPRAMAANEPPRMGKPEAAGGRDRSIRDAAPYQPSKSPPLPPSSGMLPSPQESNGGSLRSRIGEREAPRLPQTPSSLRSDAPVPVERNRPEEDRDGGRKRTISDRERDATGDSPLIGSPDPSLPPKRPRINRNRYPSIGSSSHAIAKRLLPIDPQAGDKSRPSRKD
ncbi:hypothetical protein EWM64_g2223 [Hericium alpestre]|uniref:THO complex subunit 2 n=1 Tax=Hericium alpestre TaxID=135208 RepID=A0A4Z0A5R0_9AGAM|nr:hypothetical protein EWM64_g2223 [Hericium alpestre]